MNISTPLARLAAMALATTFALPLLAVDAMAAKEKFERTKPHVNVGTIGHVDTPNPAELTAPTGGTTSTSNSPGDNDCKPDPSKAGDQSAC
jgi:hypothetical protein